MEHGGSRGEGWVVAGLRKALVDDSGYRRASTEDHVPRGRLVYLGPNDSSTWAAQHKYFIGSYEWEPMCGVGRGKDVVGATINFTKPSSAGEPFEVKMVDWTWDEYDKLRAWANEGTDLRMFVIGEEWLTGFIRIKSYREWPREMPFQFNPDLGFQFEDGVSSAQLQSPFLTGRSSILGVAGTVITLNSADYDDWAVAGGDIIINRAGVEHTRHINSIVAGVITLSVAVPAGTAPGDPVYTPGRFYGVFP